MELLYSAAQKVVSWLLESGTIFMHYFNKIEKNERYE